MRTSTNQFSWSQTFVSLFFLGGIAMFTFAQGPRPFRQGPPPNQPGFPPPDRRGPGPDRGDRPGGPFPGSQSFRFLSAEMRGGKTVKSAPFSATAETSYVQPLLGGGQATRKSTAKLYRDSEGRTRREQALNNVGPFATAEDVPEMVFINDPVAGVRYTLNPRNHTAQKMSVRQEPPPGERTPPAFTEGKRREPPSNERTPPSEANSGGKTESLGKQIIEGVEVEGTRTTLTVPPEKSGYDQPLEIVSERWYSPALKEVILSKYRDPRYGETIYRLTNINRSEPSAALFQLSADYTVSEGRPFGGQPSKSPRKRPGERDED